MKIPKAGVLFFLLICLAFATPAAAQVAEKLVALANLSSWEEAEKTLSGICAVSENNSCHNEVNWQLVGSFTEVSKRIVKLAPTKDRDRIIKRQYRLDFVLKDSDIVYCRVTDISRDKKHVLLAERTDEKAMQELSEQYQLNYGRTLTLPDLFSATRLETYGQYCGIAGSQPTLRLDMEQMLSAKNIAALENWLASPVPVKQAYAVEGFHKLKQQGYALSEQQMQQINLVKNKQGKMNSCAGCFLKSVAISEATQEFTF